MDKRNRTILTVVLAVIVFAFIAMLGVWRSNTGTAAEYQYALDEAVSLFESDEREDKVEAYHQLSDVSARIERETNFLQTTEDMSAISSQIDENLDTMVSYFADEYAGIFSENSLQNLDAIEEAEEIEDAIENLEDLLELIEEDDVLGDAEVNNYNNLINEKIEAYEERLEELDEGETSESEEESSEEETSEELSSEEISSSEEETSESEVYEEENTSVYEDDDDDNSWWTPSTTTSATTTSRWTPRPSEATSAEETTTTSEEETPSDEDTSETETFPPNPNLEGEENP